MQAILAYEHWRSVEKCRTKYSFGRRAAPQCSVLASATISMSRPQVHTRPPPSTCLLPPFPSHRSRLSRNPGLSVLFDTTNSPLLSGFADLNHAETHTSTCAYVFFSDLWLEMEFLSRRVSFSPFLGALVC